MPRIRVNAEPSPTPRLGRCREQTAGTYGRKAMVKACSRPRTANALAAKAEVVRKSLDLAVVPVRFRPRAPIQAATLWGRLRIRVANACLLRQASDDGLQALVSDDVEQLEGRSRGMGFALLPLAHGRGRRVQMKREHRLAELQGFAQAFDVGSAEFPHWRRADRVELAHRHLADRTRFMERG